jgi:hypothetical protein
MNITINSLNPLYTSYVVCQLTCLPALMDPGNTKDHIDQYYSVKSPFVYNKMEILTKNLHCG